jgi:uncharacterized protein
MDRAEIGVEVVWSPSPRTVRSAQLRLPAGSTLGDALAACGLPAESGAGAEAPSCGVWSRRQPLTHGLADGDRVEIYRPLTVDPKEARRLRYKGQKKTASPAHKAKRPAVAGR